MSVTKNATHLGQSICEFNNQTSTFKNERYKISYEG